jgi:dihydrofolate synthase/folylpolyglutamate synthase
VPGIIGPQEPAALETVEAIAAKVGVPLKIANQDWQAYAQHGRLVFQDDKGLLDLPVPALPGAHQIDNAGNAIAAVRALNDTRITDDHFAQGMTSVAWPARMQKLGPGHLIGTSVNSAELWLDGAHNALASSVIAQTLREMNAKLPRPLVIIWGLLNTKKPGDFIANFKGMADEVIAITIPDEINAIPAEELARVAEAEGLKASTAASISKAVEQACSLHPAPRILICGSLYLAGHVLALHSGEEASAVSGAAKR